MAIVRRIIEMPTPCPILLTQSGALRGYNTGFPHFVCMPHYPVEVTEFILPVLERGEVERLSEEQLTGGDIPEDYGSEVLAVSERKVRPLTFYCDSVSWDDTAANADDMMDKSGDGSREKPWRNVNYATKKLYCILSVFCGYVRLCVKGVVDYRIMTGSSSYYNKLILTSWNDDENQKQEILLGRIYDDGYNYAVNTPCILSGFHIKVTGTGINYGVYHPFLCMDCEVTFENYQEPVRSYTAFRGDYSSVFYRCTARLKNIYVAYGFFADNYNIFYGCLVYASGCHTLYGYYTSTSGNENYRAVFYRCTADAAWPETNSGMDKYGFWGNGIYYGCYAMLSGMTEGYLYGFYNQQRYETMANASVYYSCQVEAQVNAHRFYGFFTSHNAAYHCKVSMHGELIDMSGDYYGFYTATCFYCDITASVSITNDDGILYGIHSSRQICYCTADMNFSVKENRSSAQAECYAFYDCDDVYNCSASVSASASATPDSDGDFSETERACGFYDSSGCHDPCHYITRTEDGTTDYCNS